MKRVVLGLWLLLASAAGAVAQESAPDVIGIWHPVSGRVITHEGAVLPLGGDVNGVVEILTQEGPVFSGVYRWSHPEGTVLHDGEAETHFAEEMVLGVFSGDGRSFVMADTPDTGYWFGIMLDENRMELRYIESGPHAAAGVSLMERSP